MIELLKFVLSDWLPFLGTLLFFIIACGTIITVFTSWAEAFEAKWNHYEHRCDASCNHKGDV